jgi:hypothetical protein
MTGLSFFLMLVLYAGAFYLLGYAYGRNLGVNSVQIRVAIILLVACLALAIATR